MNDLTQKLEAILAEGPTRLVLSVPRQKGQPRAELLLQGGRWQLSRQQGTQAFHSHHTPATLPPLLAELLQSEYTQLTAFAPSAQHRLRLTKKGKVLASKTTLQGDTTVQSEKATLSTTPTHGGTHNRQKEYLLAEAIPPLIEMGVFTPDGRVVQRMQDKYRQVNRFVEIVDDALKGETQKTLRVVDFGCGKSYLSFVLYHFLTHMRGYTVQMTGLDLKEDVVAHCEATARRYGYTGLHFACGDIAHFTQGQGADMVLCLHACNTATDLALAKAVQWGAKRIFAVPCCQHELNGQMRSEALALLTRYGIIQERAAALFTDAIRANLLCAHGYKSQILEFVGLENTPKNLLLRAVKTGQPAEVRRRARAEVQQLCHAFGLCPSLWQALEGENTL